MTSITSWQRYLPRHWKVRRLKNVAQVAFSNVDKKSYENGTPIRLCNYTDVYNNETITAGMALMEATATPREIERFGLLRGDVLLTKDSETWNDIAIPALVADALPEVVCGYHLAILRPAPAAISGEYLHRALQASGVKEQFHVAATGVTRFGLGQGDLRNAILPVPPLPTQRAIADFLDRKTRAIDELIRKKERLIELLQEKRQALITQAVTKGLDPNVPMKDSGVPWLGEIPRGWKALELRRLIKVGTSITYGIVQAGPHVEGGIPYIRTGDMQGRRLQLDNLLRTTPEIDKSYRRSKVFPGDVVIAIRATIGKALPVPEELAGANLTQGTAKVSPGPKLRTQFLLYALRSTPVQQRLISLAKGATFQEITLDMLRRLAIPVPPEAEQTAIEQHAARIDAQLGGAVESCSKSVYVLREYRQALISAAVTGQIDVSAETGMELPGAQAG